MRNVRASGAIDDDDASAAAGRHALIDRAASENYHTK